MRATRLARPAAITLVAVLVSGCAALTGDRSAGLTGLANGDVAARGGGAVVTVAELAAEVDAAVASGALENDELEGTDDQKRVQLQTFVLNGMFQIALATTAAAEDFDIEVSDADVDERVAEAAEQAGGMDALEQQLAAQGQDLQQFRTGQRVVLLREALSERLLADDPLTEDEVRQEYEARATQFEQVSARHILVETEAEAQEIVQLLADGADFATLAEERSQDPGSAASGGSLGLTPRGSFVPEFEAAIWDGPAPVGEVLGPVETQFGFHVIVVDEFQVTPEDEALEQVRADLETGRGDELFGIWFQQVLSDADPQVQGRFGEWSPTQQAIVRDDLPQQQQ